VFVNGVPVTQPSTSVTVTADDDLRSVVLKVGYLDLISARDDAGHEGRIANGKRGAGDSATFDFPVPRNTRRTFTVTTAESSNDAPVTATFDSDGDEQTGKGGEMRFAVPGQDDGVVM
jgi:hypothetical protein